MKKKIGSSKSIKKYAMAGEVDPPIKKTNDSDSTSYYKQRANAALKNLTSDNLSNFGSNVKDFAKKQREYKSYTRRNKPGYDANGKSNFQKLFGLKNGGSVGKSKKPKMGMGGSLKNVPSNKVGLSKLPTAVRNKMGYKKIGGSCGMKNGGSVKSKNK